MGQGQGLLVHCIFLACISPVTDESRSRHASQHTMSVRQCTWAFGWAGLTFGNRNREFPSFGAPEGVPHPGLSERIHVLEFR